MRTRLLAVLLGLLGSSAVLAANDQQACSNLGGTWTYYDSQGRGGTHTWVLTQTSPTSISGSIYMYCLNTPPLGAWYGYAITSGGFVAGVPPSGGYFALTVSNSLAPANCALQNPVNITIPNALQGSNWANMGCTGIGKNGSNSGLVLQACEVPTGEKYPPTFSGWGFSQGTPYPGVANFTATLPPNADIQNWGGRTVTEAFGALSDTCTPQMDFPNPFTWNIGTASQFTDQMGWTNPFTFVVPVRKAESAPCTHTQEQYEYMDCPGTGGNTKWVLFEQHTMTYTVNRATIALERNQVPTAPPNQSFGAVQVVSPIIMPPR